MKIHEILPFSNESFIDSLLDIVLFISEKDPTILVENYEKQFKIIMKMRPYKLIIIFSHMKDIIIGSSIENFIIHYSDFFIRTDCSREFISLIFELCQNNEFIDNHREDVFNIFNRGLSSSQCTDLCMNCLSHFHKTFETGFSEIDYDSLSLYLVDDEFRSSALDFVLHIEELPPLRNLIRSLLFCSKFDERGTLCLLNIISLEEGARELVFCKKWINRDNPTIFGTLKLVLGILVHDQLISDLQKIDSFCEFLSRLIDECDDRILIHISVILSKLNIDYEFTEELKKSQTVNKICERLLRFDIHSCEYLSCIECVCTLSKFQFFSEFFDIIPKLKETLNSDSESVPMTIYAITTLSKYREFSDIMKQMKFDKYFRILMKDSYYKVYAKRYFKHMSNYE